MYNVMNFLTGELFLPSRTANQYLARYCGQILVRVPPRTNIWPDIVASYWFDIWPDIGSRYATVKIVHRSRNSSSLSLRVAPSPASGWLPHSCFRVAPALSRWKTISPFLALRTCSHLASVESPTSMATPTLSPGNTYLLLWTRFYDNPSSLPW